MWHLATLVRWMTTNNRRTEGLTENIEFVMPFSTLELFFWETGLRQKDGRFTNDLGSGTTATAPDISVIVSQSHIQALTLAEHFAAVNDSSE
jgi:hypothetical protein